MMIMMMDDNDVETGECRQATIVGVLVETCGEKETTK